MTKLETIEKAVQELSEDEQSKFRKWFAEYDSGVFDERLERDAKSGKFDERAKRARAANKAGLTREI